MISTSYHLSLLLRIYLPASCPRLRRKLSRRQKWESFRALKIFSSFHVQDSLTARALRFSSYLTSGTSQTTLNLTDKSTPRHDSTRTLPTLTETQKLYSAVTPSASTYLMTRNATYYTRKSHARSSLTLTDKSTPIHDSTTFVTSVPSYAPSVALPKVSIIPPRPNSVPLVTKSPLIVTSRRITKHGQISTSHISMTSATPFFYQANHYNRTVTKSTTTQGTLLAFLKKSRNTFKANLRHLSKYHNFVHNIPLPAPLHLFRDLYQLPRFARAMRRKLMDRKPHLPFQ